MIATRESFIAAARRWLGTPYAHQGRLIHVGVDCVGLIVCAARDSGAISDAALNALPTDYSHQANIQQLRSILGAHTTPISREAIAPGDIISFRFALNDQHVGIATDVGLIHCMMDRRGVVEVPLSGHIERAISGVWSIPWPNCN